MELKEATKQLNKTKEIFEHLKYHGWINDIKRDVDASDVIDAIDTVLAELDKQKEMTAKEFINIIEKCGSCSECEFVAECATDIGLCHVIESAYEVAKKIKGAE